MKTEITDINPGATRLSGGTNLFVYVRRGDETYSLHFWDGPATVVVTCRNENGSGCQAMVSFTRVLGTDEVRTDRLKGLDLLSKLGVKVDPDKQRIDFTGYLAK